MKINRSTGAAQTGAPQAQKSISGLSKGDTFTATVAGVSGGEVTLTMSGGGHITAKTQNPDALMKGERLSFVVEANESGQVFVKITKDEGGSLLKIAAKALSDAGLPANENNIQVTKALIEKGLAPDAEKLNKVSFGMTLETMSIEKLMFLLEENIEVSDGSLKQLNNNIICREGLASEISALIGEIVNLPEKERNEAFCVLLGRERAALSKSEAERTLKKELFLDLKKLSGAEPQAYYKRLYSAALKLLSSFEESDAAKEMLNNVREIKQAIDFQNEISEYKNYVQLPFMLDGKSGQGDLYVFKDRKAAKDLKRHATALISVNLANIGRVEAFIVKNEKSVTCAFGLSQPRFVNLFKENSFELHKLLAQKGIRLEQLSFEKADGAFNLLKERPGQSEKRENTQRKYSFDAKA